MTIPACTAAALAVSALVATAAIAAQDPVPTPAAVRVEPAAQDAPKTQEELAKLRDEKLALPVFAKARWTFDYDQALERATKERKLVFAYFTRSYAPCAPCTAVENGVFAAAAFGEFAERVVLFCHVTTHVRGDAWQWLLSLKGGAGYPHFAFLDGEGNVLAAASDRSVDGFAKTHAACTALLELEKRAEAGDTSVAADLLIARLELGQLEFADAEQAVAGLGAVDVAKQKTIDALVLGLEVQDLIAGARTQGDANVVGRKFAAMRAAGRVPTGRVAGRFYAMIASAAEADRDAGTFGKALTGLRAVLGPGPRSAQLLERLQQTLDKLHGEKK